MDCERRQARLHSKAKCERSFDERAATTLHVKNRWRRLTSNGLERNSGSWSLHSIAPAQAAYTLTANSTDNSKSQDRRRKRGYERNLHDNVHGLVRPTRLSCRRVL